MALLQPARAAGAFPPWLSAGRLKRLGRARAIDTPNPRPLPAASAALLLAHGLRGPILRHGGQGDPRALPATGSGSGISRPCPTLILIVSQRVHVQKPSACRAIRARPLLRAMPVLWQPRFRPVAGRPRHFVGLGQGHTPQSEGLQRLDVKRDAGRRAERVREHR